MPDAAARLDRLLELAAVARRRRDAPEWKRDPGDAIEAYGEACDAVWAELDRLLDERAAEGRPVVPKPPPPDPAKALRKRVVARLKAELPSLVADLVEDEMAGARGAVMEMTAA